MSEIQHTTVGPYTIGALPSINEEQLKLIAKLFYKPVSPTESVLGGRHCVTRETINGLGRAVVKHYTRGGVLKTFIDSRYVRFGPSRSEAEFKMLVRVRDLGINAPLPYAYATEGTFLYRAWLVTQEIENSESLAEISLRDEDRALTLVDSVTKEISALIDHGILHLDLHPGNVLVDSTNKVFLLDFDKARDYNGSKSSLRDWYLRRWRRAVIKHALPETLAEGICMGLRRHYEE